MITDLLAFATQCEQTVQALQAEGPRIVRGMAQVVLSLRVLDIQSNGLPGRPRYSNNLFPTFLFKGKELNARGKDYIKKHPLGNWGGFRAAQGLPSDVVNLTYTGRMLRSLQVRSVAGSGYLYGAQIVASTAEDGKKLQYAIDRYGPILQPLPAEQGEANLYATKEVQRIIQRGIQL